MKERIKHSFLFVLLSLSISTGYGQIDKTEWRLAVDVLKGKDTTKDKSWAVRRLEDARLEENDAFVTNVLGIAYLHGLGTMPDTLKAIEYFEEAGANGYATAYHNLGMYYKYAKNGNQDFKKAYEAFYKGAVAGNTSNCYNCGFMKYKGLGCEQSYEEAISLFRKASDNSHSSALYMLGLCYKNGYGVDADTALSNYYLRQAIMLGDRDALIELKNETPENNLILEQVCADSSFSSPLEMPNVETYTPNIISDLDGIYDGYLATYDWSGKYLLSEKPLTISMIASNGEISGSWIIGEDTISYKAKTYKNGVLTFIDDTEVIKYNRYSRNNRSRYVFDQLNLCVNNGMLTGLLRLYSLEEMEPDRPMYVCLKERYLNSSNNTEDNNLSQLFVYSSPSSSQIVLKLILSESVASARICFF